MATTDQQISELIGKLVEFRASIENSAKGVKDLDAAINQLQSAGSAEVKLVNLRKAQEELTKSNKLLKTSLGESFNLAPLEAYRNLLKEIKAEYQEMTKSGSAVVTPTPAQPLAKRYSVAGQEIESTLNKGQITAQVEAHEREVLSMQKAADKEANAIQQEWNREARQVQAEKLRAERDSAKQVEREARAKQSQADAEIKNGLKIQEAQRKAIIEQEKISDKKLANNLNQLSDIYNATNPRAQSQESKRIESETLAQANKLLSEEVRARQKAESEAKSAALQKAEADKIAANRSVDIKQRALLEQEIARQQATNPNYQSAESQRIQSESLAQANKVQSELIQKKSAEEVSAKAKIVKQTEAIADIKQQQLLQEEINLQYAKNPSLVSPQSAAIRQGGNTELSNMQSQQIKEMQRQEALARAEAEARAAQARLQGAGTNSAFSSVLGGTNTAELSKFNDLLTKYGLTAQNVTSISKDLSTGVSQISFSMQDANGVMQQGSIHVDRFGRILQDTSGRFKNFGDMISRNITKVLEWAISLGIVYGSIQKVTELIATMQKLQTVMVDIGIVTGQSGRELSGLFESVREIADITASDFATGIESLNVALRSTSGIADDSQRSAQALVLLKDAMTLAKLAGIDNAQAMDYLVASLKQMDLALTDGTILLDKFQAVSQSSNTTVEDLAATFSITAGAASDVGVTVDELTGLIGAFSETTTLSATETGNALRAMFSNFTQPAGIETLNKYGIAVRDLNGDFRSFTDVFKQASELARSGVLSDRQVAEIANALGGGSRRQAQVTALLTVQPRAEELARTSELDSAGKAEEALAQKTETLGSALERLQNAFDGLANSLGNQGGFLGFLTAGVNLLSGMLNIVNDITKALGPATIALIGMGVAMSAFKQYGPNIKEAFGALNGGIGLTNNIAKTGLGGGYGVAGGMVGPAQDAPSFGRSAGMAFAPVVISSLVQGFSTGEWAKPAGGIIGGGLLAVLSGNPLWAIIGQTIGNVIGSAIEQSAKYAADYISAVNTQVPDIPVGASTDQLTKVSQSVTEQFLNIAKKTPSQTENIGQGLAKVGSNLGNLLGIQGYGTADKQLLDAVQNFRKTGTTEGGPNRNFGFSDEDIRKADELLKVYEQIQKILGDIGDNKLTENDPAYQGLKSFQDSMREYSIGFDRNKTFELTKQFGQGELSKSDYKSITDPTGGSLSESGNRASRLIIALNPQLQSATQQGIQPFINKWKELKTQLSEAPTELLTFLDELTSNIAQLNEKVGASKAALEVLKFAGADPTKVREANSALQEQIAALDLEKSKVAELLTLIKKMSAQDFKFSGFNDLTDYTSQQIEDFRQQALKLQESYAGQMSIDPSQLSEFANSNPFTVFTKSGTFEQPKGVIQQFFDFVIGENQRAAKEMADTWNFQNLRNIDAAQRGRLQQAINYYTQLLKKYGMNEKNELITVLFKDNQVGQLIGSQTALQLALQDLTEVTKKQLDGVYNLPSGATAYIPLNAGQMLANNTANNASGSNIDYGNFPTPVIEKGNGLLSQINTGIQTLVTLTGQRFDPKAQMDKAKQGLDSGEYKNIYEALKAQSIFNTQIGPPNPNAPKIESAPNKVEPPSLITNLVGQLTKFTAGIMGLTSPLNNSSMRPPGLASPAVQVNVTPAKIESSYNTTTTIRLDGRILWSAIKKYAFEDYARFTTSTGSNGRSQSNVIV